MRDPQQAMQTHLANIEKRTGKTIAEPREIDTELLGWLRAAYDAAQ